MSKSDHIACMGQYLNILETTPGGLRGDHTIEDKGDKKKGGGKVRDWASGGGIGEGLGGMGGRKPGPGR